MFYIQDLLLVLECTILFFEPILQILFRLYDIFTKYRQPLAK